jgi:CRP/FNR family transcriptional regulator, cyclic AMP receptor protein
VNDLAIRLGQLSLFADLSHLQLERIAHDFEEQVFAQDQRILRQGLSGSGLYIILEGEAAVVIDGQERTRLRNGDVFGEISVLLDEVPTADVICQGTLRCLVVPKPQVREFLLLHPQVMFRLLQVEARRIVTTLQWLA